MFQNIINLFLNRPPSPPDIKPTRCEQCQGIGLVKKNTQNIAHIPKCICAGKTSCFKCENNKFKGLYEECETCCGSGKKSELLLNED